MQDFVCRVCGGNKYGKHPHVGSLYNCDACGAVFTDPSLFTTPVVKFIKLSDRAAEPKKMHADDAGYDLYAAHGAVVAPGAVELVKTDIAIELPSHHEAQVRCRSGLGKKGIQISNGIGTVDNPYRGNVAILLYNSTKEPFDVREGDRVAQLVIKTAVHFSLQQVSALSETDRGAGGFGHTGR